MDREMNEEIRLHMEMQAKEFQTEGMEAGEALLKARRAFGHVDGISEACRDDRGFIWLSQLAQDLRYGFRMLRRTPGFTAAAVSTLALGIGVNTAILSLIDETLVRQLPVRDPNGLVLFHWSSRTGIEVPTGGSWEADPETGGSSCTSFSRLAFDEFKGVNQSLSGICAFTGVNGLTVVADGNAEIVARGELVSGDYFSVLGLPSAAGRLVGPEDDKADAAPIAVISYDYWHRRFGGSRSTIGKTIQVNGYGVTIVGVSPPHFQGTLQVGDTSDLYLPLTLARVLGYLPPRLQDNPAGFWWLQVMGRVKNGVSTIQALDNFKEIFRQSTLESINVISAPMPAEMPALGVAPGGQGMTEIRHQYRRQWAILGGMATIMLAITCTNLASLLLARGAYRRPEIAMRVALGASRGRIIRQLVTESVLLSGIGGTLALPLAVLIEGALIAVQPSLEGHNLSLDPHLNPRILAIAAVLSVLTGTLFGLLPAFRATESKLTSETQGGTRTLGGGYRSALGKALVVVQVAFSLVLLVGAGLFARTLGNLQRENLGFNPGNILLFRLDNDPTGSNFDRAERIDELIAERVTSIPGVSSATFTKMPLLSDQGWNTQVAVRSHPDRADSRGSAMVNAIGSNFFSTYGIPIVVGRGLGPHDEDRAAVVAVINQTMATKLFGDENPLNQVLEEKDHDGRAVGIEVVGVSRDAKYSSVRDAVPPTIYFPFSYSRGNRNGEATFAVRTSGDAARLVPAIRDVIREVAPLVPMADIRTQAAQISELSEQERLFAWLSGFFSLLALGLVSIGLYGLLSYSVLRRTGEIGLRMALGADARGMLWMILRECTTIVLVGVVFGIAGALAVTRIVSNLLFGLTAKDPLTFAFGAAVLVGVAILAAWIPARRASRVDPMIALRCD
jgi:predicted permease